MKKLFGVLSICLIFGAMSVGTVSTFIRAGFWIGLAYVVSILTVTVITLASLCRNCAARDNCAHIFIGKLAALFGPVKDTGLFKRNLKPIIIAFSILFITPLVWMWNAPHFLLIYITLIVGGTLLIKFQCCPHCKNCACPINSQFIREMNK